MCVNNVCVNNVCVNNVNKRILFTNLTNKSVRAEVGDGRTLILMILKMKLAYFGHVVRGKGLESMVMLGMGSGTRGRGRPRRRWLDDLTEVTDLRIQQLKDAAEDRQGWRELVHVVTRGRDRLGSEELYLTPIT